jgi:hypothetical protein
MKCDTFSLKPVQNEEKRTIHYRKIEKELGPPVPLRTRATQAWHNTPVDFSKE